MNRLKLLKNSPQKRSGYFDAGMLVATLCMAFVPVLVKAPEVRHTLTIALFYLALSLSWNLVAHSGLFTFAHAAFFGVGAYSSVLMNNQGFHPIFGILAGIFFTFILALAIGIISIRLGGIYFSIFTLVLLLLISQLPFHMEFLGIHPWESMVPSLFSIPFEELGYLYLAYAIAAVTSVMAFLVWRKGTIQTITAIRESELGVRVLGVPTLKIKIFIFILASLVPSLIGSLYTHFISFASPLTSFDVWISFRPIICTLMGGLYSFSGPIFGTLFLIPLDMLVLTPFLHGLGNISYGIILVLILLLLPKGVIPSLVKE